MYIIFILIFLDFFLAFLAYGILESLFIQTRIIKIDELKVPSSFFGKKIVFITDIHYGSPLSGLQMKIILKRLKNIKPDIVLFGGDYVVTNKKFIKPIFQILKTIEAPLGKFGVLGNHDHWASQEISERAMEDAGIINLDNRSVWIKVGADQIKIGGVGDLWNDKQDIDATISDVEKTDLVFLVSHNPDFAEKLDTDLIDYCLSGHVHGGQINFFGFFAPLTYSDHGQKYVKGFVKTDRAKVIVSKGVGVVNLPFRFFAHPEIVLLEL
jgi:uncharacterized protein